MKNTVVSTSGVHGKGLYACRDFGEGEVVEPIEGDIVLRESESKYAIRLSGRRSLILTNKTKFVNHADSAAEQNVVFDIKKEALVAVRPIKAGEELLSRYESVF